MTDETYTKPLPVPQSESDLYWERARQHELWLRKCNACDEVYFYPRDICPGCFSRDTTWIRSSGRGTLYTFAIVHRAPAPAFRDDVPYVTAIVELEGGARIPTNLIGIDPDHQKIEIGMPVEVIFEDVTEKITLPKFKPSPGGQR